MPGPTEIRTIASEAGPVSAADPLPVDLGTSGSSISVSNPLDVMARTPDSNDADLGNKLDILIKQNVSIIELLKTIAE